MSVTLLLGCESFNISTFRRKRGKKWGRSSSQISITFFTFGGRGNSNCEQVSNATRRAGADSLRRRTRVGAVDRASLPLSWKQFQNCGAVGSPCLNNSVGIQLHPPTKPTDSCEPSFAGHHHTKHARLSDFSTETVCGYYVQMSHEAHEVTIKGLRSFRWRWPLSIEHDVSVWRE